MVSGIRDNPLTEVTLLSVGMLSLLTKSKLTLRECPYHLLHIQLRTHPSFFEWLASGIHYAAS